MKYRVLVDDNFHYMDVEERHNAGDFSSPEEAIAVCAKYVDDFLADAFKPGAAESGLYTLYTMFGPDPWIQCLEGPPIVFSAWDYAKERCAYLCRGADGEDSSIVPPK